MHYRRLRGNIGVAWPAADDPKFIADILAKAAEFQAPNGGMAYFVPDNQRVSQYLSAYTATAFNWLKKQGYPVDAKVEARLADYLAGFLSMKDDTHESYIPASGRMATRAVALAALAENGRAKLSDADRFAPYLPEMSILGKSYYLAALTRLNAGEAQVGKAAEALLSHANITAGKYSLHEGANGLFSRYMLASATRENCMAVSALLAARGMAGQAIGDAPMKLVRSILDARKQKARWNNTQENLFCLNALADFSEAYESQASGSLALTAQVGAQEVRADLAAKPLDKTLPFAASDIGAAKTVKLAKTGAGAAYYTVAVQYAKKSGFDKPVGAGLELRREYMVKRGGSLHLLEPSGRLKKGEVVLVNLYLSVPAARSFVVVSDPVPGGLEPVNRDLATASGVDDDGAGVDMPASSWFFRNDDWQGFDAASSAFYHKEVKHDAVRFYSEYLAQGNYRLTYAAQAIADGAFAAPPALAQEMYDEDVYGRGASARLVIDESAD